MGCSRTSCLDPQFAWMCNSKLSSFFWSPLKAIYDLSYSPSHIGWITNCFRRILWVQKIIAADSLKDDFSLHLFSNKNIKCMAASASYHVLSFTYDYFAQYRYFHLSRKMGEWYGKKFWQVLHRKYNGSSISFPIL